MLVGVCGQADICCEGVGSEARVRRVGQTCLSVPTSLERKVAQVGGMQVVRGRQAICQSDVPGGIATLGLWSGTSPLLCFW